MVFNSAAPGPAAPDFANDLPNCCRELALFPGQGCMRRGHSHVFQLRRQKNEPGVGHCSQERVSSWLSGSSCPVRSGSFADHIARPSGSSPKSAWAISRLAAMSKETIASA